MTRTAGHFSTEDLQSVGRRHQPLRMLHIQSAMHHSLLFNPFRRRILSSLPAKAYSSEHWNSSVLLFRGQSFAYKV